MDMSYDSHDDKLAEKERSSDAHVSCRRYTNYVSNSPSWLGGLNYVGVSVDNSSDNTSAKQIYCNQRTWISQNVEETNDHKWETVFQVISVSSTIVLEI